MESLQSVTKSKTLSDQAYEIIKQAIISNQLKPGEILAEGRLAKELSISRTPIKAALIRLVYEKIASINENKNIIVANITLKQVRDITEVRQCIEEQVITLLEGKMSSKRIEIIEKLCITYEEAIKEKKIEEMLEADYQFHTVLAQFTDNTFLAETVREANQTIKRYLTLSGTFPIYSEVAYQEHQSVLEAIRVQDFVAAKEAMGAHIQKVSERMLTRETLEIGAK